MDKWHAVQLAAYAQAWNEANPNQAIDQGIIVRVDKKAKKPYVQLKEYQGHHFESRLEEKDQITRFVAFIVVLAMAVTVFLQVICW